MVDPDFEEVLCSWGWWDCPRLGVALVRGKPMRFLCEFSDVLDDYPPEFQLWPISHDQLEAELKAWNQWVDWRRRFDSGEAVEPFEHQPGFAEFSERLRAFAEPTEAAVLAVPEWKLDPNRSFAGRVPKHCARWRRPTS